MRCALRLTCVTLSMRNLPMSRGYAEEATVKTSHAFTGRMCAAARWEETQRPDSLFYDALSYKLAGHEGRSSPMGGWIMVPRTRFGDDFLVDKYMANGCRQLVLLGAGMDTRAYRMQGLDQLRVFEVDQWTTFDVKEPLLVGERLSVHSRVTVGAEFSDHASWAYSTDRKQWTEELVASGFDPNVPTVWLLEGLVMYLTIEDTKVMMKEIGRLSAPGSAVFHDACSASYISANVVVGGAPFVGGSDDYGMLWHAHAGFTQSYVWNFEAVRVDRARRRVVLDLNRPPADRYACRGQRLVLFVEAQKPMLPTEDDGHDGQNQVLM
jgi:methyltransferase (TIGR00027 family)